MTGPTLVLPWPPSINRYYRRVGERTLISRQGRAYRANVNASVIEQGSPKLGTARLTIHATAHPPDKRNRDLDNLWKSILDALEFAQVFKDDNQIDDLRITRNGPKKPGRVEVTITPVEGS